MRRILFALVLQHDEYFFLSFSAVLLYHRHFYFSFLPRITSRFFVPRIINHRGIYHFFLHASQPYVHVTNSAEACITFRSSWYYIYQRILSIASSNNKCSLLRIRLMQGCYCDICKKRIRYNSDISFSLSSNVRAFLLLNAFIRSEVPLLPVSFLSR